MKLDTDTAGRGELVLELTPMIDVVFLLLIFFMLATTFMDPEREIDLDLPEAGSSLAREVEHEEIIYLDDFDQNLVPARELGWSTIHVGDPDQALLELGRLVSDR